MPHSYKTNAAEVGAAIVGMVESFGFTSTHEGRALGEVLVDETVEGIAIRSITEQCDGEGNKWPRNSDNPSGRGYRSRKNRLYGTDLTNVRTGQMLSIGSLKGTVTITQYLVTIRYGTGEAPTTSSTGYFDRLADDITDDDKAFYADQQGRRFYELDDTIKAANFTVFAAALGEHMRNPGR